MAINWNYETTLKNLCCKVCSHFRIIQQFGIHCMGLVLIKKNIIPMDSKHSQNLMLWLLVLLCEIGVHDTVACTLDISTMCTEWCYTEGTSFIILPFHGAVYFHLLLVLCHHFQTLTWEEMKINPHKYKKNLFCSYLHHKYTNVWSW